jgi:hypothetical protein
MIDNRDKELVSWPNGANYNDVYFEGKNYAWGNLLLKDGTSRFRSK